MKPQNFPLKSSLNGSEELYTQTNGISQKFTLDTAKDFINQSNISYEIEPFSVDLTKTPNDYKGWQDKNGRNLYQSIEIGFIEKQAPITNMEGGAITLALSEELVVRNFLIGDIITISNATNINNNGEWKLLGVGLDGSLLVQQTVEKYLITENVSKDGPFPTLTWKERVLLEFSWVHAQLEDGTLIWEAYDYASKESNGYWVAMRPNSTSGEYEYVSHLKMTDNFWDYWYSYTVKVDGEPNSVILTTLTQETLGNSNIGSANFKLSLIDDELVLVETIYDLEKTWNELFFELTDTLADSAQFQTPWYNSDNDWYGMMQGDEMGWNWMYKNQYFVGYNMLNGQTQLIDISESLLNIKNIFYTIDPGFTLENALNSIKVVYSHSIYGLLLGLEVNTVDRSDAFSALWSPNYTNVEYATILDIYFTNGSLAYSEGAIYGGNAYWGMAGSHIIVAEFYNTTDQAITFHRKQLDTINETAEVFSLPEFFYENIYYIGYVSTWERENSFIVSVNHNIGYARNDNFFVWRNDEAMPKLIKTPSLYPNMIEDDKLTNWDRTWNYNNINTMTINFKNDVL